MKKRLFLISLILMFAVEAVALLVFAFWNTDNSQDAVLVNEALWSVQSDWNRIKDHQNRTGLDYVVLDTDGIVLFKTKSGLSESVNAAVIHRDTILDIEANGTVVGKMIVYNDGAHILYSKKQTTVIVLMVAIFVQCGICAGYIIYLEHSMVKPFDRLKHFAWRVAGGNLDIPIEMDRHNLFGAFTESFDIMRDELKKARMAEAEANESKKELVAKLSHDIKTPVASIKAASEVGVMLTEDGKVRDNYRQIMNKADQINVLVTNLFTSALNDLSRLSVSADDMESKALQGLIESADYLHRACIPTVPECLIFADRLRLQQVFDNIFANSYKYVNTKIDVTIYRDDNYLAVSIEDYGGGVRAEELPLLKEKFKRGSNAGNMEGAGLGLYISDYFMREMGGKLIIQNGSTGLRVTVNIPMSGTI